MITGIAFHLSVDDIKAAAIIPRTTDIGDKYWVIRLPTNASIYIDDADLRTLSEKISSALEERTCQPKASADQSTVGITGSTESSESTPGST